MEVIAQALWIIYVKQAKMLKFISFGSGSSGNCYYLFNETEGLFIDVGIGTRTLKKYFREYGLSFALVKNVLVTHDHADHVKSVGSFANEFKLPVYATRKVHEGILRNYCVQKKIDKELVRYVEKGQSVNVGAFSVLPFSVPHDSNDNVGYRIECGGSSFCVMTDAGCVTEEMKECAGGVANLVIESNYDAEMLQAGTYPPYLKKRIAGGSGHLSNDACAQYLRENASDALRHVWLCHLSEENNHPELARKTAETALAEAGRVVGKDVCLDVLKRKMPTGIFEI